MEDILRERPGLQVGALLGQRDLVAHVVIAYGEPRDAQAGRHDLAAGTGVNDPALRVVRSERTKIGALEAEFAVGIVFYDGQLEPLADAYDRFTPVCRKRAPGGILKIRNDVEKFRKWIGTFEHVLERVRHDAVFIGFYREIARLIGVEGLNRAEVCRMLADHVVARIEKNLPNEVETLLRSVD